MILENTYLQQLKQADPELADLFWNFASLVILMNGNTRPIPR